MHRGWAVGMVALAVAPAWVQAQHRPLRPVSTYSIVARDSATGELGVAVQSHWFSVGPLVPWAEAGVGAANRPRWWSFVQRRRGVPGWIADSTSGLRTILIRWEN
jgi:hypothetical protein